MKSYYPTAAAPLKMTYNSQKDFLFLINAKVNPQPVHKSNELFYFFKLKLHIVKRIIIISFAEYKVIIEKEKKNDQLLFFFLKTFLLKAKKLTIQFICQNFVALLFLVSSFEKDGNIRNIVKWHSHSTAISAWRLFLFSLIFAS